VNEINMLYGNISRMILAKSNEDLIAMRDCALSRIEVIYNIQYEILKCEDE